MITVENHISYGSLISHSEMETLRNRSRRHTTKKLLEQKANPVAPVLSMQDVLDENLQTLEKDGRDAEALNKRFRGMSVVSRSEQLLTSGKSLLVYCSPSKTCSSHEGGSYSLLSSLC